MCVFGSLRRIGRRENDLSPSPRSWLLVDPLCSFGDVFLVWVDARKPNSSSFVGIFTNVVTHHFLICSNHAELLCECFRKAEKLALCPTDAELPTLRFQQQTTIFSTPLRLFYNIIFTPSNLRYFVYNSQLCFKVVPSYNSY